MLIEIVRNKLSGSTHAKNVPLMGNFDFGGIVVHLPYSDVKVLPKIDNMANIKYVQINL